MTIQELQQINGGIPMPGLTLYNILSQIENIELGEDLTVGDFPGNN